MVSKSLTSEYKTLKIDAFDYHTVVWHPLSREPPRISHKHCQKLLLGYTFVADSMGLSSFKFSYFRGGLRKSHVFFEAECIMALQCHPRSLIFGTNRKRVCDFLLDIDSNFDLILPRFRDITGFLLRKAVIRPPLHPNCGVSPWTRLPMLWLEHESVYTGRAKKVIP